MTATEWKSDEGWFGGVKPGWLTETLKEDIAKILHGLDATTSCPAFSLVLEPFRWLAPEDVRVVLIGQDPYPRKLDACGVSFQSLAGLPRSARSILGNLALHGHVPPDDGRTIADFRGWMRQGVLMTNTSLTVKVGEPNSHRAAWAGIARRILSAVPVVSVALQLGETAWAVQLPCIKTVRHVHPVIPSAEEFAKVDCFGQVDMELKKLGLAPINWASMS